MKVLLLSTFPISEQKLELINCKQQYHIYLYFLNKYLTEQGIEICILQMPVMGHSSRIQELYSSFTIGEGRYDHCIVVDNRGIYRRPDSFFRLLRKQVSGYISTISASPSLIGQEDVLFYSIPAGRRKRKKACYVGWACDPTLITSKQDKTKINILIDHPYYGRENTRMAQMDRTLEISKKVFEFTRAQPDPERYVIKRFCQGGIEVVTADNYDKISKYVQNKGLSYHEACEIYSNTDIFFVTHIECMGLVVLECAMAGAHIVAPEGYIKKELIRLIDHTLIVPDCKKLPGQLEEIIGKINHKDARTKAVKFNWQAVTAGILDTFKSDNSIYLRPIIT